MFQFQTGSIRRLSKLTGISEDAMFQFQTGSIRSKSFIEVLRERGDSFNSKLVRLEVYKITMSKLKKFQFQTGSIRSQKYPAAAGRV